MSQPKYLLQRSTGIIYGYTPILAEREDMEPYHTGTVPDGGRLMPTDIIPEMNKPETAEEVQGNQNDPNKITLIREAIESLAEDDYTQAGLPRLDTLEILTGFKVTRKEANLAMEEQEPEPNEDIQDDPSHPE